MTPSAGTIIYQSPLKIHRPVWCDWLGGDAGESRSFPFGCAQGQDDKL
jgi:hypothetical protein